MSLKAAAERVMEAINGGGLSLAYPAHERPHDAFHAECSMIARDWLAERDETPIDAAWVESLNPTRQGTHYLGVRWFDFGDDAIVEESSSYTGAWLANSVHSMFRCTTRGELLTAMRLMGVR